MSGANSHNQAPRPQQGETTPGDMHEVPEGAPYTINSDYWIPPEGDHPIWPVGTPDAAGAAHNQAAQPDEHRSRVVGMLGRVASGLRSLPHKVAGTPRAVEEWEAKASTRGETLHEREHLLHNAVYYRAGIADPDGTKRARPMPKDPANAALKTTFEWLASCYNPTHPARPDEIRSGLQHIITTRPDRVTPHAPGKPADYDRLSPEQKARADAKQAREEERLAEWKAAEQFDWNKFVQPATVRALRERYLAFASDPETIGSNDPGLARRMRDLADERIASGGLGAMLAHVWSNDLEAMRRPSVFVASYLGVRVDALEQHLRGERIAVPPQIMERLDFMLKLDARKLQMLDPETGKLEPANSTDHHPLDALLPTDTSEREAVMEDARQFVDGRMRYFEQFRAHGSLRARPVPRRAMVSPMYRQLGGELNSGGVPDIELGEPEPIPANTNALATRRRELIQEYLALRQRLQGRSPRASEQARSGELERDIRNFDRAANERGLPLRPFFRDES